MQKEIYNHWTVLDKSFAKKANSYLYKCRCDCGVEKFVQKTYLIHGKSKSCGCRGIYPGVILKGNFTVIKKIIVGNRASDVIVKCEHGIKFIARYSSGGIRVGGCPCTRHQRMSTNKVHGESPHAIRTREYNCWRTMRQRCNWKNNKAYKYYGGRGIKVCKRWNEYKNFLQDMGRCPKGFSIERIDVDGNYEPKNCKWIPLKDQPKNRRNLRYICSRCKIHHPENIHAKVIF